MIMKSDVKFEEKLTCGLENDTRNLANFYQSTWKFQKWDFDRIQSRKCIKEEKALFSTLSKVENA